MSSFDERRNASETKHAHDENKRFRIRARRNKIAATWAGEMLKLDPESLTQYQASIVAIGAETIGDGKIIERLSADLGINEDQIGIRLDGFENQARIEIDSE